MASLQVAHVFRVLGSEVICVAAAGAGVGVEAGEAATAAEEADRIEQIVAWQALLNCGEGASGGTKWAEAAGGGGLCQIEASRAGLASRDRAGTGNAVSSAGAAARIRLKVVLSA